MSDQRYFGEINKYPVNSMFISRRDLHIAGVHKPLQAGISGTEEEGADSVVLSGGYDDTDYGTTIIYTGHGGRDGAGKIIANQSLTRQNLALAVSKEKGLPIRVVRGAGLKSKYAPASGYRYDGLYLVEDYWQDQAGEFKVFRFKLVKLSAEIILESKVEEPRLTGQVSGVSAPRQKFQAIRILRDTRKSLEIKKFYDYVCQVCSIRLEGPAGPYAEAAHIKPLGYPHNGPDDQDNLLCLCPNHHILFDLNAFTITDDFSLIGIEGKLLVKSGHSINSEYLAYRRLHYSLNND